MTYQQTIRYLESFINYEKIAFWPYKSSFKLERMKEFLAYIGNPQDSLRCIHIAGTKGKGSTCAFVAYMLREAGFTVGLYTSPHLSDFRERIRILRPGNHGRQENLVFEGMISRKELIRIVEELRPCLKKFGPRVSYEPLSFFEVYTALAFVYFKQKKTDFVVLETGLGGRLDATNVVHPLACGITPISYEHTQKLGSTLSEIAAEKAGIIKEANVPVVTAPQRKTALTAIRRKCRRIGAPLWVVGKEIRLQGGAAGFSLAGHFAAHRSLKLHLLGRHQMVNAAVAVGIVEASPILREKIDRNSVRKGLSRTLWPGRCEVISSSPRVLLDGAQNAASAHILKKAIRENFTYKRLILVLGISKDKDINGVCRELVSFADVVIVTAANNPRAFPVESLCGIVTQYLRKKGSSMEEARTVRQAYEKAIEKAHARDIVVVTGSLFVIGEMRRIFSLRSSPKSEGIKRGILA